MRTPLFINTISGLKRAGMSLAVVASLFLASCDNDDTPDPVNEEEVITTLIATLTPAGGGTAVVMTYQDLDGDGPNAPTVNVSGNLMGNTTYNGVIQVLNETESPAENITLEVLEEADEHQFFFEFTGSIAGATATDTDSMGNPLGVTFDLTTNTAGAATLSIVLRHEPTKPNTGLASAGGETDIQADFNNIIIM